MNQNTLRLAAFALLGATSLSAVAGGGSAFIPYWGRSTGHESYIEVTNITNSPVSVSITLFLQDGTTFNGNTTYNIFGANPLNSVAPLGAGQSGMLTIPKASAYHHGYGKIEWQSSGNEQFALVSHVERAYQNSSGGTSEVFVPINDYKPF